MVGKKNKLYNIYIYISSHITSLSFHYPAPGQFRPESISGSAALPDAVTSPQSHDEILQHTYGHRPRNEWLKGLLAAAMLE
jgi:hypothetical protein